MHDKQEAARLEEMGNLLRLVWQKYQEYLLPENSELSAHQVYFLMFLARRGTCTPSEISQEFGITLGAVTGFVDRLYKLGLISRSRSEEDRRLVLIELNGKGNELLQEFARKREEKHFRLLEKMGSTETAELKRSLRRLKSALAEVDNKE